MKISGRFSPSGQTVRIQALFSGLIPSAECVVITPQMASLSRRKLHDIIHQTIS